MKNFPLPVTHLLSEVVFAVASRECSYCLKHLESNFFLGSRRMGKIARCDCTLSEVFFGAF